MRSTASRGLSAKVIKPYAALITSRRTLILPRCRLAEAPLTEGLGDGEPRRARAEHEKGGVDVAHGPSVVESRG